MKATYILKSSCIFDSIGNSPTPGALVICGNKIEGLLSQDELNSFDAGDAVVVDCGDKLIMPGFIDSHMHAGANMDYVDESYCVDVSPATSFEGVIKIIEEYGAKHPNNKFLLGINFNLFNLEKRIIPTAKLIDSYISDRPVIIHTWDCHTFFTNSKGIELSGIKKDDPDPNHACGRDENGDLTGEFNDSASFILSKKITRTFAERQGSLRNFMAKLNACGITSFADMFPSGDEETYPLFKSLEDELTTRIHFFSSLMDFSPELVKSYRETYNSKMLQFSGLKCLMDGVLTVFTAWMLKPYSNNRSTCGFPALDKDKVKEKIFQACKSGINVRVHTIGDAAVKYILDVFEDAQKMYGNLEKRHCMEHIEYINPADIPRFAELGIVADMHPRHLMFYIDDAIEYLGEEREKYTWVFRELLKTGALIGTGSDFPVVNFNPMLGIYTGVTRAKDNGMPEGGWHPEQKLMMHEILKMYTIGSACAINRDKELGTLEKGKLADVVVLDRNLFEIDAKEILQVKPVLTMMDGEIVYKDGM